METEVLRVAAGELLKGQGHGNPSIVGWGFCFTLRANPWQELADTDEKNAQAKQDIEDTKNSLSSDEQFLMMLKVR
jgi:hypothetical protein